MAQTEGWVVEEEHALKRGCGTEGNVNNILFVIRKGAVSVLSIYHRGRQASLNCRAITLRKSFKNKSLVPINSLDFRLLQNNDFVLFISVS